MMMMMGIKLVVFYLSLLPLQLQYSTNCCVTTTQWRVRLHPERS